AKRYAVPAINRALAGLTVPTAVHLCFGYAAVVKHQKPTGYSFLPQLAEPGMPGAVVHRSLRGGWLGINVLAAGCRDYALVLASSSAHAFATPTCGVLSPREFAHPPVSINSRCFHDSIFWNSASFAGAFGCCMNL